MKRVCSADCMNFLRFKTRVRKEKRSPICVNPDSKIRPSSRRLPASKHVFTHLIWHMQGFLISADEAAAGFAQVTTLDDLAFPTALRVYREIAEEILAE